MRALRADGLVPTAVQVDGVRIELVPVAGAPSWQPPVPGRSIVAEYGGAEIERLLNEPQADLVDDDEQPAVRGQS